MHVVATAGHVDHGKSTLIRAITGTDPDRLAEERVRGLTIDIGFAHTVLPSGREVDFVDVPGHARFIRNMLAGVSSVDACLFVVDASEGWKPQSEEHLRIINFMNVRSGLVALTKVGLVSDEQREVVRTQVIERVADSVLAGAEVVATDALIERGLDDLRVALDHVLAGIPAVPDLDRPRLWVDRSFAISGAGTVVTGTLAGGRIGVGDSLLLVGPGRAAGRSVRVRSLQAHGQVQTSAAAGRRIALNLVGVAPREIARGAALVRPGQWHETTMVDATFEALAVLGHSVSRRGAFKLYVGSGGYPVRLRIIGSDRIESGQQGLVRLWLPVALPLIPGDRFVVRESGRSETVGGGEILDVAPLLPASRARPSRSIERVLAEREWADVDELYRLTGEHIPPTLSDRWVIHPLALEVLRRDLASLVDETGALGLDIASLDERARVVLSNTDGIVLHSGRAFMESSEDGTLGALANHPWLTALKKYPWLPPDPLEFGAPPAVVSELVRRRLVVARDGTYFAPEAVAAAARVVAGLFADSNGGITVSEVRNALGTTRKYALPLLAELDATGVTHRRGDRRVAGPRLPTL